MDICSRAAKVHGNSFTYTLINSLDIDTTSHIVPIPVSVPSKVKKKIK
jgi:hypothetical protein